MVIRMQLQACWPSKPAPMLRHVPIAACHAHARVHLHGKLPAETRHSGLYV